MAAFNSTFQTDLAKPSRVVPIPDTYTRGDNESHTITVLVYDSENPSCGLMAGSVSAAVARQDGNTIPLLTGTKGAATVPVKLADGSTAQATPCTITLTQACFDCPGQVVVVIRLVSGETITSIFVGSGKVNAGLTNSIIDPGDVITDITALIAAAEQAAEDAETALAQATAVVSYAEQTGKTDAQKAQARTNIGAASEGDVTDLRGAIRYQVGETTNNLFDMPYIPLTVNGLTFSYDKNGYLDIHGTASASTQLPLGDEYVNGYQDKWLPAGTYTFAIRKIDGTVSTLGSSGPTLRAGESSASVVASLREQVTTQTYTASAMCYIRVGSGTVFNHLKLAITIVIGSTELPFIPHLIGNDFRMRVLSKVLIPEYSSNVVYSSYQYVVYNGVLYQRKSWPGEPQAEEWTSGHWTAVTMLSDEVAKRVPLEYFAPFYDATQTYSAGDVVIYNGYIRKAKADISTPEDFVAGHWNNIGSNIFAVINGMQNDISTMQPFVPSEEDSVTNSKSFSVSYERYENIQYVDVFEDISSIQASNSGAIAIDRKVKFRNMPFSLKCITDASKDNTYFRVNRTTGIPMSGTQEFELFLYIKDVSLIGGNHKLRLRGITSGYNKYYDDTLANGWNRIRFVSNGSNADFTKTETEFRLYVYTQPGSDPSESITIWIGGIFAVKPDKANIIIIDDGPYDTFYQLAYPALKSANIPVTWAMDCGLIGSTNLITQSDVDTLAYDGISEFSFHSYDGVDMTGATAEAALRDTINNIRYLQQHGLQPSKLFRAAWFHNDCTNPGLANEVLDASASHNGSSGITQFPFADRYNIPRYPMQGRTTSEVDLIFYNLQTQHSTILMYTHGISDAEKDTSTSLLAYYIGKITDGVENGWLRATTFSRMMNHYKLI